MIRASLLIFVAILMFGCAGTAKPKLIRAVGEAPIPVLESHDGFTTASLEWATDILRGEVSVPIERDESQTPGILAARAKFHAAGNARNQLWQQASGLPIGNRELLSELFTKHEALRESMKNAIESAPVAYSLDWDAGSATAVIEIPLNDIAEQVAAIRRAEDQSEEALRQNALLRAKHDAYMRALNNLRGKLIHTRIGDRTVWEIIDGNNAAGVAFVEATNGVPPTVSERTRDGWRVELEMDPAQLEPALKEFAK